jgi:hypothetical protein
MVFSASLFRNISSLHLDILCLCVDCPCCTTTNCLTFVYKICLHSLPYILIICFGCVVRFVNSEIQITSEVIVVSIYFNMFTCLRTVSLTMILYLGRFYVFEVAFTSVFLVLKLRPSSALSSTITVLSTREKNPQIEI